MTHEEQKHVSGGLASTAEVFGETLSELRVALYLKALDDLPARAVLWALGETQLRLKFFPKPVEIRDLILGSPEDRAQGAWSRFLRALECVGTYESVDFRDGALHATVEALGGWGEAWRIERMAGKDLDFKRAEFVRLYLGYARLADARMLPPGVPAVLAGQHDATGREGQAVVLEGAPWRLALRPAARKALTP